MRVPKREIEGDNDDDDDDDETPLFARLKKKIKQEDSDDDFKPGKVMMMMMKGFKLFWRYLFFRYITITFNIICIIAENKRKKEEK